MRLVFVDVTVMCVGWITPAEALLLSAIYAAILPRTLTGPLLLLPPPTAAMTGIGGL